MILGSIDQMIFKSFKNLKSSVQAVFEMFTKKVREKETNNIISQPNHPNILRYIEYSPHNFKRKPKPIIITELTPNSSLNQILKMERDCINIFTKKLINIYGIAAGIAFLYKQNIIHRYLKPANILSWCNLMRIK